MYKYDDFFFFFLLTICQAFHCRYNPVRKVLCKTADGTNIKQIFIYKYRKKIQVHFNRILTCFVLQNNDALFVDTKYVVDNVLGTQELGIENTV